LSYWTLRANTIFRIARNVVVSWKLMRILA
jgi:hypothetical protein